jgi:glycosyltransferase involved in cell wall biosynthesis
LIDSIARAREVDSRLALVIVGEGPRFEPLKTRAEALNLGKHVHFTGAVPHRRVPEYIGAMDIAVAPYRRQGRFYFSPLKIMEYMAMAKPVVASSQGQIRELIESGENGILCEPDDVAQFAESLVRLASDPVLRRRLGHNAARTVAASTSWRVVAERVASVAQSVVGPPRLKSVIKQRVSGDPGQRGVS